MLWVLLTLARFPQALSAQPVSTNVPSETLTSPLQVWALSTEARSQPQPIRFEGRVSYFDLFWRILWLEKENVGMYVQLSHEAPVLTAGQRVVIEGTMVPSKGLSKETVSVRVLNDHEPMPPLRVENNISDYARFNGRVVEVDAYVDSQQYIDVEHLRLSLFIDDRPVTAWVRPDDLKALPQWEGKFVHIQALLSARFDPTSTQTAIELWVAREHDVAVVESLTHAARFNRVRTPINEIFRVPLGTEVVVSGHVQSHEAGSFMTLRDSTGQLVVFSLQQQRLSLGTEVEVCGRVALDGARWVLKSAWFRKVALPTKTLVAGPSDILENVDQIRQISLEEAARGRVARISGLVTWSLPEADFFFVQDVGGGIRVHYQRDKSEAPARGMYLQLEGTTYDGGYVPALELRSYRDLGALSLPAPKPVTFIQAITGKEDGQWVEMRGFIQRIESKGDWRYIYVTTPEGEIVGHLKSPVNFLAHPGSLVRMHGACEATADAEGRLTGVMLRVPFLHDITIEEDAPVDQFDLPNRSIKGLRQLSGAREMMRARISAVVLHAEPGRQVYVQEGDSGLLLLTRETEPLQPGDRIEAVGILGWEGVRLVLRETVYRKIGTGLTPDAFKIVDVTRPVPALDMRVVSVRGTLLDAFQQHDRIRLTLQSGNTLFEARLDTPEGDESPVDLPIGAGLELTGIYKLGFDDSRQTRDFALHVTSPAGVRIIGKPRLWTVQRALTVAGVLAASSLLGVAWITALRRRVRRQTNQIREQLERQARLEVEVQRATRLESLGVLAGGIAHDFNNLLTIILGNLGLAMLDDQIMSRGGEMLQEIDRAVGRARNLTQQLLTFAKGGDPLRSRVLLPEIVKNATELVLHGSNVRCEYDLPQEIWSADIDKDQIAQAIQNIVLNAVQAMPQGGTLRVALANEVISGAFRAPLTPGRYIKLTIADTGQGMSADILPKIFDPFFSTRKVGSGMGLATVYSIVRKHSGRIDVESRIGYGSTFVIWLPAAPAASAPTQIEAASAVPGETSPVVHNSRRINNGEACRILLMDDEEAIRTTAGTVLRHLGFEVVLVADGGEAVREFSIGRNSGRSFDLIVLDLTIPGGIGGRETIELIRKLDPRVPAIVCSGYSSDPVMANFNSHGFQAVVPKPYDVSQLACEINKLLGRSQQLAGTAT